MTRRTTEVKPIVLPVSDELVRLVEPGHQYFVGEGLTEREVVSLSRLLEAVGLATDYSKISVTPEYLDFRARVGTCVHGYVEQYLNCGPDAAEAWLKGEDRFIALHARPHVEAFLTWIAGRDLIPIYVERPAYNPDLKYACTEDIICLINDEYWVLDVKTTSKISKTVALQTMGQESCYSFAGFPRRGALWLPKTGRAKVVEFTDWDKDYLTLKAACAVYHARSEYLS